MSKATAVAIAVLCLSGLSAQDDTVYYIPNLHFPETSRNETYFLRMSVRNTHDEPLLVTYVWAEHCEDLVDRETGFGNWIGAGEIQTSTAESTNGEQPTAWTKILHPTVDDGKRVLKIVQYWGRRDEFHRTLAVLPVMGHHEVLSECPGSGLVRSPGSVRAPSSRSRNGR